MIDLVGLPAMDPSAVIEFFFYQHDKVNHVAHLKAVREDITNGLWKASALQQMAVKPNEGIYEDDRPVTVEQKHDPSPLMAKTPSKAGADDRIPPARNALLIQAESNRKANSQQNQQKRQKW